MLANWLVVSFAEGTLASPAPQSAPRGTLALANASNQPATSQRGADVRSSVHATRIETPPAIDGHIDEILWRRAARITRFVQRRPLEGARATEATEVWIAFDQRSLFLAVYAHYSDPNLIRANRADRDRMGADDTVSVMIDPFFDQQRAYVFSVNGYGVQGDSIVNSGARRGGGSGGGGRGGGGPGDSSWDALFYSAGRLVEDGWIAEIAIPFKSLRYPARRVEQAYRWGLQIQREITSKNETIVWAPVSRDVMGMLSQTGTLDGLTGLSTSRNLEFLPTFTAIGAGALNEATGRYEKLESRREGGVNVKYGLRPNLIADFTVNPDFSQIESDQVQIAVNNRYPLFYPERRPFFLEGQEIFSIGGPVTITHTRTIVDPRFGAKLTGEAGGTMLGVLIADDAAPGRVDDPTDPAAGATALLFMGRARRDLYSESFVGAIATNREFLDGYSRLGGVDGQFKLGDSHRLAFRWMASARQDVDGVRLSGRLFDLSLRKEGRNLIYNLSHFQIDPGFGTDVGFVRRVDTKETDVEISYRWWLESVVQRWGPRGGYLRNYDYAGVLQDERINADASVELAWNVNFDGGAERIFERYLGMAFHKTRVSLGGRMNASRFFSLGLFFDEGDEIRYVDDPFLGKSTNLNGFVALRPTSRLRSRINFDTTRFVAPAGKGAGFVARLLRAETTYQFTNQLLVRNITDYDSSEGTFGVNLLATYRVNAGTAFYVGYDDHYQGGNHFGSGWFPTSRYQRTNRAVFTKLQYLFRL